MDSAPICGEKIDLWIKVNSFDRRVIDCQFKNGAWCVYADMEVVRYFKNCDNPSPQIEFVAWMPENLDFEVENEQ